MTVAICLRVKRFPSITTMERGLRKAVAVIRVSRTGGREGESFASPDDQRERIETECKRLGLALVHVYEEMDISGRVPIEERKGLVAAVEDVEASRADVVVTAYFDRLVRSLRVQDEVVTRVEEAGGQVLTVDVGRVTAGSAAQWLSGTMLGAVSEYYSRSVGERVRDSQIKAVARGVPTFANIPPGFVRDAQGVLEVEPAEGPIVAQAFALRAEGETISEVRAFLLAHGIERSYHGVQAMLASRLYLGELHFGELSNLEAHEAIVTPEVWRAVQAIKVTRGRRPQVESLLGRLKILRCGTCDKPLTVNTITAPRSGPFRTYRCPPAKGDCAARVSIGADLTERAVTDAVVAYLGDLEGRASAEANIHRAEVEAEEAQAALDSALRTFAGFEDETAARERLSELRAVRDAKDERLRELGGTSAHLTITAVGDWDRLSLAARRALVQATVRRVAVAKGGRGADRLTIELLGE